MLTITISEEKFDEDSLEFSEVRLGTIVFEHSLASISKWESDWEIPFFKEGEKSDEQILDYIHNCMVVELDGDRSILEKLTTEDYNKIVKYIQSGRTATWFSEREMGRPSREIITSEVIYYWMIAYNIPFECQYWNINRLLTLIKVCDAKMQTEKKMSKREIISRNKALNEARKKQYNTKG